MSRRDRMKEILSALHPEMLEIEDESHEHKHHVGTPQSPETHFKVLVVSEIFNGLSRIERQRRVQDLLKDEFTQGLHALSIRALTPEESQKGGAEGFISPSCRGHGR